MENSHEVSRWLTIKLFVEQQQGWPTEAAVRAYRAAAPGNGFSGVFKTLGRRVLINPQRFWEVVEGFREGENDTK